MYIFRGRGVFIDVYKADDTIFTSVAAWLADIDLWRTYRAIDSVATGRILSLFCDMALINGYERFVLRCQQLANRNTKIFSGLKNFINIIHLFQQSIFITI